MASLMMIDVANNVTLSSVEECRGCITNSSLVTILAEPVSTVDSVVFSLTGDWNIGEHIENVAPYYLWSSFLH